MAGRIRLRAGDTEALNLRGADLTEIQNWKKLWRIKGANIRNPPDGFVEWALANGAIDEDTS